MGNPLPEMSGLWPFPLVSERPLPLLPLCQHQVADAYQPVEVVYLISRELEPTGGSHPRAANCDPGGIDEAPDLYLKSNRVICQLEDMKIGMPLEVFFQKIYDKITIPFFRPMKAE